MKNLRKKFNPIFLASKLESTHIFILVSVIIIALVIETSIVKVAAFTGGLSDPLADLEIFTAFVLIFSLTQYLILRFVRRMDEQNKLNKSLRITQTNKWVSIILYILTGTLSILVLQMVFTSSYNILFLEFAVCISYVPGLAIMGFLSYRLISWFKSNHDAVVLAYSVAILGISINAVFTILFVTGILMNIYTTRSVDIQPVIAFVGNYDQTYDVFTAGYVISSVISFVLTWAATVLLLRNYSRKLGTVRYWILVSIPLLYFLSQFGYVFLGLFTSFRISQPILFGVVYSLFFSGTVPAGGVLFGIAFWSVARNINRDIVKKYMMISAYGMMILFSSNQASALVRVFYPPFGLVTLSFFGLASYLMLIGIYSSAMSVAQDSELRRSIRRSAQDQAGLLREIGTSQMEDEIRKKVKMVTANLVAKSEEINEQIGISPSLGDEDINDYLEQVIEEIKKEKPRS